MKIFALRLPLLIFYKISRQIEDVHIFFPILADFLELLPMQSDFGFITPWLPWHGWEWCLLQHVEFIGLCSQDQYPPSSHCPSMFFPRKLLPIISMVHINYRPGF